MHGRRLLALGLPTLLLAAAPAAAPAQTETASIGAAKLGERASAECRRYELRSDEACWTGIGAKVVREDIERFRRSETHAVLDFQQRLGDALPFRDAPWIGTHNSFNTPVEDPTLSHTDSNQQLTPVQQLDIGVRSLELDVHWMPSPRGPGFAPVVCHGQGYAGCTTERLLGDHLREIAAWLDEHPDEVLLLYLEDQIDDATGYGESAKVVHSALGDRLYAPRGAGCTNLPLDLTRKAVRAAKAQVVVVGDCGSGAWQGVSHAWPASVRFEGRPMGWRPCDVPADAGARIVRFFEDSTFLTSATAPTPVQDADDGLTPETTAAMLRCGVDLLGFDQLLPFDGRLQSAVWSWAEGEIDDAGECAAQRQDGSWISTGCSAQRPIACQDEATGAWRLVGSGRHADGAAACAAAGLAFDPPRTAKENAELAALPGQRPVWVNVRP